MNEIKIKQLVPSKFCLACRKCCRFSEKSSVWTPQLTNEEIKLLKKKKVPLSCITSEKKINLGPFPPPRWKNSTAEVEMSREHIFICPFLNIKNNKCVIYKSRPFECQLYPYLINREKDSLFLAIDPYCPYTKESFNAKKLKSYANALSRFLDKEPLKSNLKNNPELIHTYPGVINLIKLNLKSLNNMKLKEINTKNYKTLNRFLKLKNHELSAYALQNICIWKALFKIYYTEINNNLCMFFENKTGIFMYLPPLFTLGRSKDLPRVNHGGKTSKKTIDMAFEIMDKRNKNKDISRIENVEERDLVLYQTHGFKVIYKTREYICEKDSLAALKGASFKTKRNLCNHFTKHYKFEYLPFLPRYRDGCVNLYNLWAQGRKDKYKDRLYQYLIEDNKLALLEMFRWYKYLNYIGRVIIIDKKIKAFTFGFEINKETFCVLYEIADLSFKGIAQFISQRLSQELKYKYINLMDDSGLEGLRKVKLSYRPVKLVNSYIVRR